MQRVIGILLVLIAGLAAGACGVEGQSSDTPPWGLDSIEVPDTEGDVRGVFAALPEEIDGRSLSGGGPGGYWAMYGESDVAWSIGAMPSEILENPGPGIETPADWVAEFASSPGGATVEASVLDPAGNLIWVATNAVLQDLSEQPPREGPIYMLAWAKPDGSWAFSLQADSEAGRIALVQAFVTAASGMTWIITALVLGIMVAIGWWVFRYARSVFRGDYRHPKDRNQTWWVAGGGGHGGGGQVPPLLPDPDPDDEIR